MADQSDDEHGVSRRQWLKQAGAAGAAVVLPAGLLARDSGEQLRVEREPLEHLSVAESDVLEAIVARLIPTDESGPGAREARAAHYIDRALGGALASSLDSYRLGLAAVDAFSKASKGARFADLTSADQDAILSAMEKNTAPGFTPSAAAFFTLVRTHTIQGTFSDPHYGGNRNFVGWDLIGYPGLRLAVGADDQRLDPGLTPTHVSAYDHAMFSPKPPRAGLRLKVIRHGD